MKFLKMLALAAVAVAAMMACIGAGTASAAGGALCSTATNPCTSRWATSTAIQFGLKSGSSGKLTDTSGNILDTCTSSTVSSNLSSNPGGVTPASGAISTFTWGGCTVTTDTLIPGGIKVVAGTAGAGVVTANARIEITVNVFSSCNYGINSGDFIGEISEGIGTGVVLASNMVVTKQAGGFLCPETTRWTAEYVLTKPPTTTFYASPS